MKKRIEGYISEWEHRCYDEGIPDESPIEINHLVPSYKLICLAILRNDYSLTSLGFQQPKSKVYSELKRIELRKRKKVIQLKLNI